MRYCKHTQWLGLATSDGDVFVQSTDRLHTILEDLPDPDEQHPSLLVFIGNRSKAMAIKELAKTFSPPPRYGRDPSCQSQYDDEVSSRGQTKLNGRRAHGEIHLHIHAPSAFSSRPVLLAEGDLPSLDRPSMAMGTEKCHELASRQLNPEALATPTLAGSADRIYFRLLSPFTDVFCFFADDVGKFRPIVQRLALWLDLGQPSTLPRSTRPKVLIVTERGVGDPGDDESDLRDFTRMLSEETTMDITEQFSGIRVLGLAARNKNLSNKSRHRELFEQLLNCSDQVREARAKSRTLFSAHYFSAFFRCALDHLTATSGEPFNFIATSRSENPVSRTLQVHLEDFLRNIKTPQKLIGFAIPIIASSFLLDSYPPNMHFFSPIEVFRTVYKEVCHQVCRTGVLVHEGSTSMILPSGFLRLLESEFIKQVEAFASLRDASGIEWHQENLFEFKADWITIRSADSCFVCFQDRPVHALPCGHIVCRKCVRMFGIQSDSWTFDIHHCFLCGLVTSGISIRDKPPTAAVNLLSIDGGGARGIIPLVFLQVLEEKIGLQYPVQENFHYIVATSSGAITGLALGKKGWTVEDSIHQFERTAKVAFQKYDSSYFGWLCQLYILLRSLVTNSIYPTQKLETLLKEAYGSEKILDCSGASAMGIDIGVTVTSMKPEPFLLTNYNGVGDREDKKPEYGVLLGNVPIWEIARAASAAPGIFTPKSIAGLGKFQDGGLKHNNPLRLGLKEIRVLYPNDPSAKRSALKVSLGTGKAVDNDSGMDGSSSWWRDMWFIRLGRALWSSMDGDGSDDTVYSKRPKRDELKSGVRTRRGEYFRFNVEFIGREPRLDDANRIPEMKMRARNAILQSAQVDRLTLCFIARLFIFELESAPRKENGRYACTGYILCSRRAGTPSMAALLERLTKSSAKFLFRGRTLPGSIRDRSSLARDGNFRKRVCFDVDSKQDLFSLQLREEGSEPFDVSGSPFSVDWLLNAQGLGQPFSRPAVKRKRRDNDEGLPRKRPRL